jgi:hypothetical protein
MNTNIRRGLILAIAFACFLVRPLRPRPDRPKSPSGAMEALKRLKLDQAAVDRVGT